MSLTKAVIVWAMEILKRRDMRPFRVVSVGQAKAMSRRESFGKVWVVGEKYYRVVNGRVLGKKARTQ